jgi:hypothetical protein
MDLTLVEGSETSFSLIPVQQGFEQYQASVLSHASAKSMLLQSQISAKATGLADMTMDGVTVPPPPGPGCLGRGNAAPWANRVQLLGRPTSWRSPK